MLILLSALSSTVSEQWSLIDYHVEPPGHYAEPSTNGWVIDFINWKVFIFCGEELSESFLQFTFTPVDQTHFIPYLFLSKTLKFVVTDCCAV